MSSESNRENRVNKLKIDEVVIGFCLFSFACLWNEDNVMHKLFLRNVDAFHSFV